MKVQLFVENAIRTNSWVVIDEETDDAIIIDCGGGYEKILDFLITLNANLKYILCTHGHFDHIVGIVEMQKNNIDVPVYINKNDENLAYQLNDMLGILGISGSYPKIKIDNFIDETSELKIGNKIIQIFETPGHTPGGLCFKIENLLFSGDSLFHREIGRCDLPGGNFQSLIYSLKSKILTLPEQTVVYPGHGSVTSIKEEKFFNPYLK